ncbi:MAG: 3-hydroxyacyl-ACP dehydratase [Deltaproteobacteria bacterium HGW-Deltaproteobacteria-19]|jgi:benzoyl-CoA reductase/2-hydroxyglutaryl-CoA dehydratase subunit BcrC/BadD/HgdB|nr:MAG: 3-hydroxyacyl-ACP dehydratase [Deltaproteobacteria bacterium HGW-Deltaproteobacteria-19]PKQ21154.1 MAG: 3-hydroxyacyl-ACP dehydratase [Actinobacteria bacterium HGW-Actinobacteria-6]
MSDQPVDYHPMWAELGLDLPMHDALLEAVGGMYGATFMSQTNRPEGMGYLDFVMSEVHGLRIKELHDFRKAGGKVVGTYCLYVPEELIRAAGAWSVGICAGAEWAYDEVEQILPRNTCALIKSMVGFKLGKVCPYLEEADLLIGETTCDGKKKAYEELGKLQNLHVLELPQMKREKDLAFWRSELVDLVATLEELTGKKVTAESLKVAIKEVNDKRRALQRVNAARAADPAPISGLDSLLAVQVAFYDDVPRFTQMMNALADELEKRAADGVGAAAKGAKRVLITGTPMALPNWKLHELVEKAGGVVVGEEMCTGSRYYEKLVDEDATTIDEMLDGIAAKYLDINCACFTPNEGRIDDVIRMAKELGADGVIDYSLQFCGLYEIESTSVDAAVREADLPVLKITTDYSAEDVGQLATRIEAFLEML